MAKSGILDRLKIKFSQLPPEAQKNVINLSIAWGGGLLFLVGALGMTAVYIAPFAAQIFAGIVCAAIMFIGLVFFGAD